MASPRRFGHSREKLALSLPKGGNLEVQGWPTALLAEASFTGVTAGGRTSGEHFTWKIAPRGHNEILAASGSARRVRGCPGDWFGQCFTWNMAPRGREGFGQVPAPLCSAGILPASRAAGTAALRRRVRRRYQVKRLGPASPASELISALREFSIIKGPGPERFPLRRRTGSLL